MKFLRTKQFKNVIMAIKLIAIFHHQQPIQGIWLKKSEEVTID